jgi:hypothetical protein
MKYSYLIIIALFSLIIFSCSKKKEEPKERVRSLGYHFNDTTLLEHQESAEIKAYREFLHKTDSTDMTSFIPAINTFKSMLFNKPAATCDSAFMIFQNFADTIEAHLNMKLMNDTTDYSPLFRNEKVSQKIKRFQQTLIKAGFKLRSSEDMPYIEQDRNLVFSELSAMLTTPMQEYIKEIAMEHQQGFANDGTIIIPPDIYIERVLWYENFIKANPDFVLINNCKNFKKAYFTYLITGYENTTLMNEENTQELSPYFQSAYAYLAKKYPDSETLGLIKPYWNAIKQHQTETLAGIRKNYIVKGLMYDLH